MSSELFDAVLVCSGRFSEPLVPQFKGASTFKGKQFHSQMYKTSTGFENKRVLLVGLGNSSGDIAAELAHVCSQVYAPMVNQRALGVINNLRQTVNAVNFDECRLYMT